ncbi:hypothetical protein ACIBLA_22745 [Streptomyces sp. NPDC050433]|uniref:hypothetical protein n=1 Tax=Streptomyces sp. NPDC050433 TaxID=3365615 RepID=UPI003789B71D
MIEEVLTLLAPGLPRPSFWNIDWSAIEAELGHRLPTDYKRLCDHLPPGRFRDFLWLQHPLGALGGSLLGREAELIATVREVADITVWEHGHEHLDDAALPGMLYPCLITDNGDTGYWLAARDDPDSWTIMLNKGRDPEFSDHGTTLSEFLYDFLTEGYPFGVTLPDDLDLPLFTSDF